MERSTRPAFKRERHKVRLPKVRIEVPLSFISRTASTGFCVISCVFGHDKGSVRVLENTIFDIPARASVPGSPSAANPDMSRYVFGPSPFLSVLMLGR